MAKKAVIKTSQNSASVVDFINAVKNEQQRKDTLSLVKMMKAVTGEEPKMWGTTMIGFGSMVYKSPSSGREVDWMKIGFSPRKSNLSLNLAVDIQKYSTLLKKLGKHKTGVGCLYIDKLEDVDLKVLKELLEAVMKKK